jgi:hypothetical protein
MLKSFFALSERHFGVCTFCYIAKNYDVPTRQIICGSGEVYKKGRSVIRNELCTASLIFVLKKRVPSLSESIMIRKEITDVATDQLVDGNSQDIGRSGIRVQAIAFVIDDQDSIEYVLENRGKLTIGVTEILVRLPVLLSKMPE